MRVYDESDAILCPAFKKRTLLRTPLLHYIYTYSIETEWSYLCNLLQLQLDVQSAICPSSRTLLVKIHV